MIWITIYSSLERVIMGPLHANRLKHYKRYCKAVGIEDNVGTHTLRKTWAYHSLKIEYKIKKDGSTSKNKFVIFIKRYLVAFMTTLTYNIIKRRCSYVKF